MYYYTENMENGVDRSPPVVTANVNHRMRRRFPSQYVALSRERSFYAMRRFLDEKHGDLDPPRLGPFTQRRPFCPSLMDCDEPYEHR